MILLDFSWIEHLNLAIIRCSLDGGSCECDGGEIIQNGKSVELGKSMDRGGENKSLAEYFMVCYILSLDANVLDVVGCGIDTDVLAIVGDGGGIVVRLGGMVVVSFVRLSGMVVIAFINVIITISFEDVVVCVGIRMDVIWQDVRLNVLLGVVVADIEIR